MSQSKESFIRFTFSRRLEHIFWITSFIMLAITGLPQKFHSEVWAQQMIILMGGIEFTRVIHRWAAAVMMAATVYHLIWGGYLLFVKKQKFEMMARKKDLQDVGHMLQYFFGLRRDRPKFDRFSYIEKFDYWAVFWGMFIMAGSGLILWFPVFFAQYFPGIMIPLAKTAHSDEALLAVSAILIWHMYNAHFNPRIFPFNPTIFTGKISKERMQDEHALEYERLTGDNIVMEEDPDLHVPWVNIIVSALGGIIMVTLFGWLLFIAVV